MDPARPDAPVSLLAYAHPILVGLAYVLALVVFSQGLKQRDQRVRRTPAPSGNLRRHVKLGPWAVGLLVAGFFGGILSSVFVRGWTPMTTWHGWLGLAATASYVAVWWMGRQLAQKQKHLAVRHGLVALAAMGFGALAVITGISLLP